METPSQDLKFMRLALREARKARGRCSPNPMVGAVLVKDSKLIAKAFHRQAGLPHAEAVLLQKVQPSQTRGATLYVTLEPCCHLGKRTPPCAPALIEAGIARIVVGTVDPNPLVAGRGIEQLRRAGLSVELGILETECCELNRFYNHWIQTNKPYVVLKIAASLDGRIALASGLSQWISSPSSRRKVHELRAQVDAILVGVGTVKHDDPLLTARSPGAVRQPLRVVLDPLLEIPVQSRLLEGGSSFSPACLIVTTKKNRETKKAQVLTEKGAEILSLPEKATGVFRLSGLLSFLGKRKMASLLIEGGSHAWTSFIEQNVVQELQCFTAPFFLGADSKPSIQALGLNKISKARRWKLSSFEQLEEDLHLCYRLSEAI